MTTSTTRKCPGMSGHDVVVVVFVGDGDFCSNISGDIWQQFSNSSRAQQSRKVIVVVGGAAVRANMSDLIRDSRGRGEANTVEGVNIVQSSRCSVSSCFKTHSPLCFLVSFFFSHSATLSTKFANHRQNRKLRVVSISTTFTTIALTSIISTTILLKLFEIRDSYTGSGVDWSFQRV